MITKLLDSQSFFEVWKSAVRRTFCAIVRMRNIICGPLREDILFAYPTNFTSHFEKNLPSYLEL